MPHLYKSALPGMLFGFPKSENLICKYLKETIIKYIIFMEMYTDTSFTHMPTASLLAQTVLLSLESGQQAVLPFPRLPPAQENLVLMGRVDFLSTFLSTCQHLQPLQTEGMTRGGEQDSILINIDIFGIGH